MSAVTLAWLLVFLAGVNSTIGNLMLKQSRSVPGDTFLYSLLDPWFVGGLFFYGLNVVLFAKSLDYLPVSIAYPVLAGSGFILLVVLSRLLFAESVTILQIFGILAILGGIFLVSLAGK